MSTYEQQRLENIRKNKELLASLGLSQPVVAQIAPVQAPPPPKPKPTQKRKRTPSPTSEPPRRSRRLAGLDDTPQSQSQSQSTPSSSPISLRPVPRPAIPSARTGSQIFDPTFRAALPTRDASGTLIFSDAPHFTPNLTPPEVLALGSYGGTAFRAHHSSITKTVLAPTDIREFPASWSAHLPASYLHSPTYDNTINKYGVRAGQSLQEWEAAGWVHAQDPRGWFQWYCRFYLGRRSADDEWQIKRWKGVCGPSGRFRRGLVKKLALSRRKWNDETVERTLRQTLQHWAYRLTEADYKANL